MPLVSWHLVLNDELKYSPHITVDHEVYMETCTRFHGNLFNTCIDISIFTTKANLVATLLEKPCVDTRGKTLW